MAFVKNNIPTQVEHKFTSLGDIFNDAKRKGIVTEPSFDIFGYAKTFDNIEIVEEGLASLASGMIEHCEGKFIITINKWDTENRKRFTLAHELGHYFMHKNYLICNGELKDGVLFRRGVALDSIDKKELDANEFAAKILMPAERFKDAIRNGTNTISKLAEFFKVSEAAAKYRAYKLGLIKEY